VNASPAAAAGISRVLAAAGHKRELETTSAIYPGFYASPEGDHVRVEYSITGGAEGGRDRRRGEALADCAQVLARKGYEVETRTEPVAVPGGWERQEVLWVRKESWGR